MKKLILALAVFLSLAGVLTSCSNDETPVANTNAVEVKKSEILQQLQTINDSLNQNVEIPKSRGFWSGLYIVLRDAMGAHDGGKIGALTGAVIGSAVEGVGAIPGAAIGRDVGAVIGAIAYSHQAYKETCKGLELPITDLPYIMGGYQEACTVTSDSDEVSDNILVLDDNFENIGRLHNKTLNYLLDNVNKLMPLGDDWEIPEGPEILEDPVFSAFELAVLESDEYVSAFNHGVASITGDDIITSDGTLPNDILVLYFDAINNFDLNGYHTEIVNVTNQYLEIISSNNELTEDEKNQLYITLAVAVYSYDFWSNFSDNDYDSDED